MNRALWGRIATWALAILLGVVIAQAIRAAGASRRADRWEAEAKAATDSNRAILGRTAAAMGEAQRVADSAIAAQIATGAGWRSEAERLGGVVWQLQHGIPQVPPVAPDTCRPWVARAAALVLLTDTLRAESEGRRVWALSTEGALRGALQARDTLFGAAVALRHQLEVSDSLLRTVPRYRPPTLALLLDAHALGTQAQATAALGLRTKGGQLYVGAGVDDQLRRRLVLGWRAELRVF